MRLGALFAAAGLVFAGISAAAAHPGHGMTDDGVIDSAVEVAHQHGGEGGHLAAGSEDVALIGKLDVQPPEGGIADVAVKGDYAYLNAWRPYCPNAGVHIVDIADPANPAKVGFIRAARNSYPGEGAQVLEVTTKHFSGDILLHNNEACDSTKPFKGGASLWNVTDPLEPEALAKGVGDQDRINPRVEHPSPQASQSHSVFAWDAGASAYMVLVDNEEAADVDIFDITQPAAPKMIAEYDLNQRFPQIEDPTLGSASSFLHDMIVKEIGGRWVMLLSYWDGGYVTMDVTDPMNATYIGDSDFTNPDPEAAESGLEVKPEGNAHQAEFSLNNDYIVAADEDFAPYSVVAENVTDGVEFAATQGSDTPKIDRDRSLTGQTVFVGRACNVDAAPPAGDGAEDIAVVERGACTFTEKVANVEKAGGYDGVIIFNLSSSSGCSSLVNMAVEGDIPALFVGRDTAFAFFDQPYDEDACRAGTGTAPMALGSRGDSIHVSAIFDGWGYVHLYRNGAGKLAELDTYAIPEAHDPDHADGFGDLTVHEVAMSEVRNDLAYFSYYAAGFRVARIVDDELVESGHFIDEGGNNFWGVQVWHKDGKEFVLASDRDAGLYIFDYTGEGSAN